MVDPQAVVGSSPPDSNPVTLSDVARDPSELTDPIGILEGILNPQAGAEPAPENVEVPPPEPPQGPSPEEIETMRAQHAELDQAAARAKLEEIHAAVGSPEHQAQVQKDQATDLANKDKTTEQEGFEINQVDHITIQVDEPAI